MEVNNVVKHVSHDGAWIAVDGSKRAAKIGPRLRQVLGENRRGVVEIGYHDCGLPPHWRLATSRLSVVFNNIRVAEDDVPIQWLTHIKGSR